MLLSFFGYSIQPLLLPGLLCFFLICLDHNDLIILLEDRITRGDNGHGLRMKALSTQT